MNTDNKCFYHKHSWREYDTIDQHIAATGNV
uniref:Uncharacterized protein n=1 Tax=Arundo donax TaxID=35708 RepID=A0A0A9BP98_ARUDO